MGAADMAADAAASTDCDRSCALSIRLQTARRVRRQVRRLANYPGLRRVRVCSILEAPFGGVTEGQRATGTAIAIGIGHCAVRPAMHEPGIACGTALAASVRVQGRLHLDTVHSSSR